MTAWPDAPAASKTPVPSVAPPPSTANQLWENLQLPALREKEEASVFVLPSSQRSLRDGLSILRPLAMTAGAFMVENNKNKNSTQFSHSFSVHLSWPCSLLSFSLTV